MRISINFFQFQSQLIDIWLGRAQLYFPKTYAINIFILLLIFQCTSYYQTYSNWDIVWFFTIFSKTHGTKHVKFFRIFSWNLIYKLNAATFWLCGILLEILIGTAFLSCVEYGIQIPYILAISGPQIGQKTALWSFLKRFPWFHVIIAVQAHWCYF